MMKNKIITSLSVIVLLLLISNLYFVVGVFGGVEKENNNESEQYELVVYTPLDIYFIRGLEIKSESGFYQRFETKSELSEFLEQQTADECNQCFEIWYKYTELTNNK